MLKLESSAQIAKNVANKHNFSYAASTSLHAQSLAAKQLLIWDSKNLGWCYNSIFNRISLRS